MSKIEKLLDKTKRENEINKWIVYAIAIVAILGAIVGLFGGLLLLDPIVNDYIENNKVIVSVYDFYDLKVGENQTVVYFVGSSFVGASIDSDEINKNLVEKGYSNITAYNLGIDGMYSLERSLQIQNIIDSSPALVIFGESYIMAAEGAGEDIENDENIIIMQDRLNVRDDAFSLYSPNTAITIKTKPSILENKRFLQSALFKGTFSKNRRGDVSTTTDIYDITRNGYISRVNEENNPIYAHITQDRVPVGPVVTADMNNAKRAIIYNAKTVLDAGIPTIIMGTPLHPYLSKKITNETRQNFVDMVNLSGAKWYDFEFALQNESYWYKDAIHVAPVTGAKALAPMMADLIIQEIT